MVALEIVTATVVPEAHLKSVKSSRSKEKQSSKKRKLEHLVNVVPPTLAPAEIKEQLGEMNSTDDALITDAGLDDSDITSKKRKLSITEIEVDITAPEPPSKKALRRLKKGKSLPPLKSGADSTPEPEVKPKKAEVEKRSEHGVWIGNLPWHISKIDLRTFLVSNTDLTEEMITRIHMPSPNDSKSANKVEDQKKFAKPIHNKGFAYVDFSNAEAVSQAIELSEQLLSGRRVLIKNQKSFEGRPEKTKEETRKEGKPPSKRVFLGNLSFDTTEDSLTEHFEKCGLIEAVKVATFEDTGKCKGYAWITFAELAGAENAVRGFVRIEEPVTDDSASEAEPEVEPEEAAEAKPRKIKTKTRKWWVNKIKGRPLRMEFAEDAQVRYKKRYGKEGTKRDANSGGGQAGEEGTVSKAVVAPMASKKTEYILPYGGPRLTGGIVESKGTKVTF